MPTDLRTITADIVDTGTNSNYFIVGELSNTLTSGKNALTLNGSNLLLPTSNIYFQVYDSSGNLLYTEIARGSSNINYREGVSIIISIWVDDSTAIGTGKLIIVGQDTNSKIVKWTKNVNINPYQINSSKIRFYNTPSIEVDPYLSEIIVFDSFSDNFNSGTSNTKAIVPKQNFPYFSFDYLRNTIDYRVYNTSGNPFDSFMEGNVMNFTNINGTTASFSSNVLEVISDSELKIEFPYLENNIVKSISSSNWNISYIPYEELNSPQFVEKELSGSIFTYKQSVAYVYFKNINTFTGNVYRFKLYRKGLNSNFDSECIADDLITTKEILIDDTTPNRSLENIGYFYETDHIQKYWFTSSNVSYSYTTFPLIDSMFIENSYTGSSNIFSRPYILSKDDTTTDFRNSTYIPYDATQSSALSGSAYDSNFLRIFNGVEYVLTANIIATNSGSFSTDNGILDFYLTGSLLNNSVSNQYDGYGVKLMSVIVPSGTGTKYLYQVSSSFTLNEDVNCALVLSPYNASFYVSKISIQPKESFSFSPQIFYIKVPFPIDTRNSRYVISAELFDVNSDHVPITLETTQNFDPLGESLFMPSASISESPNYVVNATNASFQSLTVYPGLTNLSNLIVQNITANGQVTFNNQVYIPGGNALFTSSWANNSINSISSSYSSVSSYTLNSISSSYASSSTFSNTASFLLGTIASASYATTSSYSNNTISSSFASNSNFSNTASYALNSGISIIARSFTSSVTYIPTTGTRYAIIEGVGGGGGSAGSPSTNSTTIVVGGGAGGGAYFRKVATSAELISGAVIVIGNAGSPGSSGGGVGGNGGNTVITYSSVTLTAGGGQGGSYNSISVNWAAIAGSQGGVATGGDDNFSGGVGGTGAGYGNQDSGYGGNGGSSFFSGGSTSAEPGNGYGSGAGGLFIGVSGAATPGLIGGIGYVRITEFL